ncbi:MAG: copper resistance system multicopper oxidase [Deltaproteobacteria bacterium]|nr:copper resistance system multicopper oxidase [Deltaproteobacteria bacterium]
MDQKDPITRRQFLGYSTGIGVAATLAGLLPAWAREPYGLAGDLAARTPGEPIDLWVRRQNLDFGGRTGRVLAVNGTVPGPLVRLREGEDATIRVHNELDEDTSVHWHGILVPFEMDGVPGVSYPGIRPGETFTYRFRIRQSGTYWYHSHTGLQEQLGHYGPLVIDPAGPDPVSYDREHVVVLSDWTFANPYRVLARLKKKSDYYNFQQRTLAELFRDGASGGWGAAFRDRLDWGRMRMSPTDIADVTGYAYTYLVNGRAPEASWTGLFAPGERVRLRFINAATMSYFNVRIPGLPMTVVQADGQDVKPVETDELQIAVAETYDVVVRPQEDRAYVVFAEAMDRSGYGCGTLAPRPGMTAPVPDRRERPLRTMIDMGMDMGDMALPGMETTKAGLGGMAGMDHGSGGMPGMAHMPMDGADSMKQEAGPVVARHGPDTHGPGNVSVAWVQRNRLGEPGTGLENAGHRVLVYTDLRRRAADFDPRPPEREVELHLTGNMERYVWGFDGKKFSEAEPIPFRLGERLRLTLVNDTMMEHPIHLHGMWMELENGHGERIPRKHTVSVKPAERLSVLISADAPGRWAFHCHLLYHMEMGMFRVVRVASGAGADA